MASKRKKGSIQERIQPRNNNFTENKSPKQNGQERIIVDFSCPFCLYSCKVGKGFTSYHKNSGEFLSRMQVLFGEALQHIAQYNFDELCRNERHTHIIDDEEKLDLIEKILNELIDIRYSEVSNKDRILGNYMDRNNIWQIGFKQGVRLVGRRNDNIFNLLFIDYHHLIYSSDKYNNVDYKSFTYCPMTSINE